MTLPELPRLAGPLSIQLTDDYRYRGRAMAVPGAYWSREARAFMVDNPDPRAAAAVIALFPHVLVDHPELVAIRDSAYGTARPHDYATELALSMEMPDDFPLDLYDWQDSDAGYLKEIMRRDGGGFVAWDRGLGKTVIAAAFIRRLGVQRALIVSRNDAKEDVWLPHLTGYTDHEGVYHKPLLPGYNVQVLPDSSQAAKRDKLLDQIAEDPEAPLVLIIHYEAIRTVAGNQVVRHRDGSTDTIKARGNGWKRLGKWGLMVYDESHHLASYNPNSNRNTQQGKALSVLRREHVDMALNLSGSAIMNKPDDLFGQLHFLFPNIYRAKWADFNDRFVDYVEDGPRKVAIGFKLDQLDNLRRELGVFMVHRKKEEVFDLPPLIHQDREITLLPEQRRVYDAVRDEFWAAIETGGIKAINVLDQLNKLRRIATAYEGVPSAKLEATLRELEAYPDDQFVIFTWYKYPGRALEELLGDEAVVVDGDVPKRHRTELLRRHRDGKARVLVGSIATIGESLNLQYMHEAIRLDRHWNPEANGQTVDRLNRNGQVARVTLRDLWAKDTVDTLRVKPSLMSKESLRKAVFG